jgi:hypothetical protein
MISTESESFSQASNKNDQYDVSPTPLHNTTVRANAHTEVHWYRVAQRALALGLVRDAR